MHRSTIRSASWLGLFIGAAVVSAAAQSPAPQHKQQAILGEPMPPHATPFTMGAWRSARAMALAATGQLDEADQELTHLRAIVADPTLDAHVTFSANTGLAVLRIAPEVVAGEPADWHAPGRQTLGAVLLEAGRADEAEWVFWEDLQKNPANGWSLFGLARALEAQGTSGEAHLVRERFARAGREADVTLTSARSSR